MCAHAGTYSSNRIQINQSVYGVLQIWLPGRSLLFLRCSEANRPNLIWASLGLFFLLISRIHTVRIVTGIPSSHASAQCYRATLGFVILLSIFAHILAHMRAHSRTLPFTHVFSVCWCAYIDGRMTKTLTFSSDKIFYQLGIGRWEPNCTLELLT